MRNLIIMAASNAWAERKVLKTGAVKKGGEILYDQPIEWEVLSTAPADGMNLKHVKRVPMNNQPKGAKEIVYKVSDPEVERKLYTDNPDKICQMVFGPQYKVKDAMDWDGAWDAVHASEWYKNNPEKRQRFQDDLRNKLVDVMKKGMVIPQVICDELGIPSQQINEGGNRFKDASRINQDNAKATMDEIKERIKEYFGMDDSEVIFTGSTGKKLPGSSSGDVDCAISMKKLNEKFGLETPEEWFDLCRGFA